jgi:hypothetical protein
MQALGDSVRRFLVRHPSTVVVLAVGLLTALALTGTAAAEHAATHHVDHLGWNGTVEPMDGGGGSLGPTDP